MMIALTVGFLIVALLAARLGFRGRGSDRWEGGKLIFLIFLALAVVSFFKGVQ